MELLAPRARFVYSFATPARERNFCELPFSTIVQLPPFAVQRLRTLIARYPHVVYFASNDPDAATQVLKWFEHGFFSRDLTLVIGKLLGRAATEHARAFEAQGVSFVLYRYLADLELSGVRAFFYPYNTQFNPELLNSARHAMHVFIGHGDSDKLASTHPMIRMYDRIFVSGQVAVERLLGARIVSPADVAAERVVRIGMPYLGEHKTWQLPVDAPGTLLYAPTWEGRGEHQYSSLKDEYGRGLVARLLSDSPHNVVFRPHPSTGARDTSYRRGVVAIIADHVENPRFFVHMRPELLPAPLRRQLSRTGKLGNASLHQSLERAHLVFSDLSSVATAAVHACRPFVLLANPRNAPGSAGLRSFAAAAMELGGSLDGNLLSSLSDSTWLEGAASAVREARSRVVQREPYLEAVPTAEVLARVLARAAM